MLIPLGIFASSGSRAAGAFDLLQTQVLGSAASSVTFSSLGTYSSTYQHLQLRVVMRGNNSSAEQWDTLRFTFNGDSGSNYAFHNLVGVGTSVVSGAATSQPRIQFDGFTGSAAASGSFGGGILDILDPFETSKNTTVRGLTGRTSGGQVGLHSGVWLNTAAITSISLTCFGGTLQQFSRFSLYGIKATA
jgi:hypothetical protein